MSPSVRIAALAAVVSAASFALAPASAASFGYLGGCAMVDENDPTPGSLILSPFRHAAVYLLVVPTDPAGTPTGATATVSCELRVAGASQGTVLGPTTGTGVVADANPHVVYVAGDDDLVEICEHVTVGGEPYFDCTPYT